MRVSKFYGLTFKNLYFENRRINVEHQLLRTRNGEYKIGVTKSMSGRRYIAMDDDVYASLKNMIANRPKAKIEMVVDGYSGFIMLDKNEKPKVALHIENEWRWSLKKYAKLHPDEPLPHITAHVCRHTYCSNMAKLGMNPKTLQYLLGHSDISVTMNVYTHIRFDDAEEELKRMEEFSKAQAEVEQKNEKPMSQKMFKVV